jgi:hypothetical protein
MNWVRILEKHMKQATSMAIPIFFFFFFFFFFLCE